MFQGDGVTVSRIYPSVLFLRKHLSLKTYTNTKGDISEFFYVTTFMTTCLESLNKRFTNTLLSEDLALVSTFLDPRHGINAFESNEKKILVKNRIRALLSKQLGREKVEPLTSNIMDNMPKTSLFLFTDDVEETFSTIDPEEEIIEDYIPRF